jgi:kinesin family protein 1
MGTGDEASYGDPGVIPRVVEDVFRHMEGAPEDGSVTFSMRLSYLEIHNEMVRDLLHPLTRWAFPCRIKDVLLAC